VPEISYTGTAGLDISAGNFYTATLQVKIKCQKFPTQALQVEVQEISYTVTAGQDKVLEISCLVAGTVVMFIWYWRLRQPERKPDQIIHNMQI